MTGISVVRVICLFILPVCLAMHGRENSVCTIPTNPRPGPKPVLANQFSLRVECDIIDKNYTTDIHERYDFYNNRGSVHQWFEGIRGIFLYDYKTNELLTIITDSRDNPVGCMVQDLSTADNRYMFGVKKSPGGSEHIFSVAGALKFGGDIKEDYIGTTIIRGTQVDQFRSCVYWDAFDATMTVDWYFTSSAWASATDIVGAPVRCHIVGMRYLNDTYGYPIEHIYDFSDYRPGNLSSRDFEVPKGVVCAGRKTTKPLPKVTKYFSFTSEIVIPDTQSISFIRENYDYNTKLVRYDYIPASSPYGTEQLTEVHDFNTGVAYIMDPMIGNCSYRPIESTSFDVKNIDPTHLRIRTSLEFFNFNNKSYVYDGVRTYRNIPCDVWIAAMTDWPPGVSGINSTWEWYFAQPQVSESVGFQYEFGMPIMLEITATQIGIHFIYNVYDYDEDEPNLMTFDISPCFDKDHRRDFQFSLPGHYQSVVAVNLELFKYFLIVTVAGYTAISPLRVSNIRVDMDSSDDMLVLFTMLGKAPIVGDIKNQPTEVPLDVAATLLTEAIDQGKFVVNMDVDTLADPVPMVAKPYSSKSWNTVVNENPYQPSTTYDAGAMAGVGVGLLFFGFFVGFLILFAIYKKRGGFFLSSGIPNKRLEDTNEIVNPT